jgi:four helix bundle protein
MKISSYRELVVYQNAFKAAMEIFWLTAKFPKEERYSLTDQIRRSSRSVCANLGEAWRKRRYKAAFVSKLSDADAEASETLVWLEIAKECGYLQHEKSDELITQFNVIGAQLAKMMDEPDPWCGSAR